MSNKDILSEIDEYDSSEYMDKKSDNNTAKNKSDNDFYRRIFDNINSFWDNLTIKLFAAMKNIREKRNQSSYENSEDDKHKKLFNLIFKYFSILIVLAVVLVFIVAFFKVFVFSNKITNKIERVQIEEVKGIDFNIDTAYSWESRTTEDIGSNRKNIAIIKESIVKQSTEYKKGLDEIKDLISTSSIKTQKQLRKETEEFRKSMYSYVDERNQDTIQKLSQKIDEIPKGTNLNGSFMEIPKNVKAIVRKTTDYIDGALRDGNISENVVSTSKTDTQVSIKKEEKAKLIERDKKIFLSINIESVASDMTGYDIDEKGNSQDTNNTLPPLILRQGLSNGVLVTGISAPTFAIDNAPAVVMLTFKGKSIISNMFEQDVENCTATGSVFGNIITRRAEILVNKISCTYVENGKQYMIRSNVKAWVFDGYDGRLGIPGILVDNAGAILNDSIIIGMLQGMGTFVAGTAQAYASQGVNTLSTNGQPTFNPSQIAATGVAGGLGENLSSGFDTVTQYYQKIIDTLYPYIDVKGGRKISIFFDGGETLTPVEYTPFMVSDHENKSDTYDEMEIEVEIDEW